MPTLQRGFFWQYPLINYLDENPAIDNEKKPIIEDYFCVTEPDSKVPNAPCIFPFHYKGVAYEGCPIDREDKIRRCTMGKKPS